MTLVWNTAYLQKTGFKQHLSICEKGRFIELAHGSKSTSIKSQAIILPRRHYLKSFNVLQGRWILNSQSCASVRPVNERFPLSRSAVLWHTIVLSFIDLFRWPHIISRAVWKTYQREHEAHSATDCLFAFMKLYVLALSYGGVLEQDI